MNPLIRRLKVIEDLAFNAIGGVCQVVAGALFNLLIWYDKRAADPTTQVPQGHFVVVGAYLQSIVRNPNCSYLSQVDDVEVDLLKSIPRVVGL